jgi:hypothetical protein
MINAGRFKGYANLSSNKKTGKIGRKEKERDTLPKNFQNITLMYRNAWIKPIKPQIFKHLKTHFVVQFSPASISSSTFSEWMINAGRFKGYANLSSNKTLFCSLT